MRLDIRSSLDYDIACGLRGPDHCNSNSGLSKWRVAKWKEMVSAPLRFFVGMTTSSSSSAIYHSPERAKEIWRALTDEEKATILKWAESLEANHVQAHANAAYRALITRGPKNKSEVREYFLWLRTNLLLVG